MTPPPNALRCPCGRGGLRVFETASDGFVYCDHSGRLASDCAGDLEARRSGEGAALWNRSDWVDMGLCCPREGLRRVRTWPYATEEAHDGEAK